MEQQKRGFRFKLLLAICMAVFLGLLAVAAFHKDPDAGLMASSQEAKEGEIQISFTLLGDTAHGTPTEETGTHTLSGGNLETWISEPAYAIEKGSTVIDALLQLLEENDMSCINLGGYVSEIERNGEKLASNTNGSSSGWLFTVNGEYGTKSADEQYLENGDAIVFHYTDDFNAEFKEP